MIARNLGLFAFALLLIFVALAQSPAAQVSPIPPFIDAGIELERLKISFNPHVAPGLVNCGGCKGGITEFSQVASIAMEHRSGDTVFYSTSTCATDNHGLTRCMGIRGFVLDRLDAMLDSVFLINEAGEIVAEGGCSPASLDGSECFLEFFVGENCNQQPNRCLEGSHAFLFAAEGNVIFWHKISFGSN